MGNETEIKLPVKDLKEFVRTLKRLGARKIFGGTGRVHEWNILFDTPQNELGSRGQLLRIRTERRDSTGKRPWSKRERVVLTFKQPAGSDRSEDLSRVGPVTVQRHKIREEIELEIGDSAALTKVLEGIGLRGWFRYEKFRTTYRLPGSKKWADGLLIEVDETPIGTFVELEGPPQAIDRAAREMGFSERDYIVANYLTLYREECARRGEEPGQMVFRSEK
jgi:adenylate cyclase, class 2